MEAPGENLLIKLWETLADKGIGSLFKPWQIKREGKATAEVQAETMLLMAQAEKAVEEIKKGNLSYIDGQFKVLPNPNSPNNEIEQYIRIETLPQIIIKNSVEDGLRKEINVSKAILIAQEAIANDPQSPPEESIGDDWLYRWRDYAGEVSSEELQLLWGELLAGELKKPNSFSLRTLEFIRNLSKEDAEKIVLLNSFVIGNFICQSNTTAILDAAGLTFKTLLGLQEIGILSGVGLNLTLTLKSTKATEFYSVQIANNKVLVISSPEQSKIATVNGILNLTTLGFELSKLGDFKINEEYIKLYGGLIKSQGFGVTLADIVDQEQNGRIRFNNPETL